MTLERSAEAAPPPVAGRLADFALGLEAAALPAEVVDKATGCLTDFFGCVLESRDRPWSRQALAYGALQPRGPARVIGTDLALGAGEAAFVNGSLGHGLVREDMHVPACSHLGVVVWPALLALADLRGGGAGPDLIAAGVAGYEVGARIGRALFDADLAARLRPTGTIGAIAAAAAGCRLLRLSRDETIAAIGFAANCAAGVNEWPWAGGHEMFFHAGFAARSGITAVLLAEAGAFASPTALDGRAGLFAAFGRRDRAALVEPLADGAYEILAVYWKPAPACNYVQTPCQATLALVRQGIRAEDVVRVEVDSFTAAIRYPGCNQPGPFPGILEAKMSIQYAVAAVLVRGAVEEANYVELDDPEVARLARATDLRVDRAFEAAYPARQGSAVTVTLRDGTRKSVRLEDVTAVDRAGVRDRVRAAATERLGAGRAADLIAAIDGLPEGGDVAGLTALAVPS